MKKDEKTKISQAYALKYKREYDAPKVVAGGSNFLAQKIIEKAKENDVPLYKDEKLVKELAAIDIGDSIPPELYEIVAQILVFVSDLEKMEAMRNAQ